ncbi:MAG TPA: Na/Pi symporter, partial [bacterium]|nr:Na/Pi symporter [bacterium]
AALVLGDNIGTTITAILASIGANHHAKRAAVAHTVFNVMGVAVVLIFFYPFDHFVDWLVPGMPDFVIQTAEQAAKYKMDIGAKPYIGTHIAMFHSLFNITNVIVFTPLIGVLAKVVTFIIPTPKEKEKKGAFRFSHIHFELIDTPAIGIAESEKELVAMANRVKKNGLRVRELFNDKEVAPELFAKIEENENLIDEYRKMITSFLLSLSQKSLSERDSHIVGNFITAAANLEKFADFLANIAVQFRSFKDNGLKLSKEGQEGLASLTDKLMSFFDDTVKTLEVEIKDTNEFLKNAEKRKRELKAEIREAKISHFNRLKEGKCMEEASMIYIEMLTNLDGMASQVHNIAEVGAGHKFWT